MGTNMAEVLHLYIVVLKFTFLQPLASASECSLPWSDIWQILTASFVAIEGSMSVWKVSVFSINPHQHCLYTTPTHSLGPAQS